MGLVGILENAFDGNRCKASTPVKLPVVISGRLGFYGWMCKKAGKNKLRCLKDQKLQLPPINPNRTYIFLAIAERSHVETNFSGKAFPWEKYRKYVGLASQPFAP